MRSLLVIATIGRDVAVDALLASLAAQRHRGSRIVLVDQNADDRLVPVVATWRSLGIEHVRCAPDGVSQARNRGLERLGDAELIAFPDDDCVYEPDTLAHAVGMFARHADADVIMGHLHLPEELGSPCPDPVTAPLERPTRYGLLRAGGTPVQFFRRCAVERAAGFDRLLGPGAGTPWVSGEDSDYLLRAGGNRGKVLRSPAVRIFHPPVDGAVPGYAAKAYGYGRGRIRILRKHGYPGWFILASILHPLSGCLFASLAQRRFRWHLFCGRLRELLRPYRPAGPS